MQHHAPFGYPTPPASPTSYDNLKCGNLQQAFPAAARAFPSRCTPLAPEQRLGRLLEGKLQLTEILGTGAYGVVYLAHDIKTGIRYAVKCLSKFNADGTPLERRQIAYQQREIRLHYLASAHPNVVSMLKIVEDSDCIYVVLEYCHEGDLFLNITELSQYVGKDELARRVFLQILDAVEHCHKLGIYHRDLKPENILVSDNGATVKLADFGLATADARSEDYGCGSTFYMSPECLDPVAERSYYMCAPNDVWSLGVILVNLTCGRNPWKQASLQDSTYRAYTRSREFLKTILPLTDDMNDILARIFDTNPDSRIGLAELRTRIMLCPQFTVQAGHAGAVAAAPATVPAPVQPIMVEHLPEYAGDEDAILDDYDYESPLSPESVYSDEGSLTSSGSTIDELDEDDFQDLEPAPPGFAPKTYDAEQAAFYHAQGILPQQQMPVPVPIQMPPLQHMCQQAQPPPCAPPPKSFFPLWDVVRYMQQVPMMQHPPPFQQVQFMPTMQGCY